MHRFSILSLFPEYFESPFSVSILRRAQDQGLIDIELVNIRDFAEGKHRRVDERPYGGGPGMVMMPGPCVDAIRHVKKENTHTIYLSPQGTKLNNKKCQELANFPHLLLLCGHYEGIDERIIKKEIDEEISIGDFVLTNGCLPAIVIVDAVARFIPGVLGHEEAALSDSFQDNWLEGPQYTRPEVFEDLSVPSVLLSGNHQKIKEWRKEQSIKKTRHVRPELTSGVQNEIPTH